MECENIVFYSVFWLQGCWELGSESLFMQKKPLFEKLVACKKQASYLRDGFFEKRVVI